LSLNSHYMKPPFSLLIAYREGSKILWIRRVALGSLKRLLDTPMKVKFGKTGCPLVSDDAGGRLLHPSVVKRNRNDHRVVGRDLCDNSRSKTACSCFVIRVFERLPTFFFLGRYFSMEASNLEPGMKDSRK
jgi:hypothetical protein